MNGETLVLLFPAMIVLLCLLVPVIFVPVTVSSDNIIDPPRHRSFPTIQYKPPPVVDAFLYDDFTANPWSTTSDSFENAKWNVDYLGFGYATVKTDGNGNKYLQTSPSLTDLHALKIDSNTTMVGIHAKLNARLDSQAGSPQSWYTFWPFLKDIDETTHYYFALKTNGWELGKKDNDHDPSEELQEFIATGSNPKASIGSWYTIEWRVAPDCSVNNERIKVWVDDTLIINTLDTEDWQRDAITGTGASDYMQDTAGNISLYSEGAKVSWDNIYIESIAGCIS